MISGVIVAVSIPHGIDSVGAVTKGPRNPSRKGGERMNRSPSREAAPLFHSIRLSLSFSTPLVSEKTSVLKVLGKPRELRKSRHFPKMPN
jgi:hypothetical protein